MYSACLCIWRHLSAFFELFKENVINKGIDQKPYKLHCFGSGVIPSVSTSLRAFDPWEV